MDFKELMQKMQQIDEGIMPAVEECGDMPSAIIHGGQPPEESLNMNLTINSKGADGIRELLDVLKGIGGDTEPKDLPHDDDSEIVIGDDYGNSVEGDAGSKVFGTDAVIFKGNDMHNKGRSAVKVNGGENPQLHHESIVNNLFGLYEEVKNRANVTIKENNTAVDAWLANPENRVTYGKTKRTKKDRMIGLLPGEHKEGGLKSADAKIAPSRATRHDHIDVKSKDNNDWEAALDALKAMGDTDWKGKEEEERKRKADIEQRIEHEKWLKRKQKLQRMRDTKWTPTRLKDK